MHVEGQCGFAQLDASDGKLMTKSLIDAIDGPCRRSKEATILATCLMQAAT
jgi:hypothetical protein